MTCPEDPPPPVLATFAIFATFVPHSWMRLTRAPRSRQQPMRKAHSNFHATGPSWWTEYLSPVGINDDIWKLALLKKTIIKRARERRCFREYLGNSIVWADDDQAHSEPLADDANRFDKVGVIRHE